MNLPLIGAPEDRDARLLLALLSNRERLLRYLLMLLDRAGFDSRGNINGASGSWGDWGSSGPFGIPLLEPLLRALADDPTRLDHIERLVSDLERTEEGRQLLPDELVAVWTSIRSVRESGALPRKESSRAAVDAIDTERILAGLKDFQRKSGEYVYQRLYGRAATRRFLLADEVGLGKTLVARGVIAKAIERLREEGRSGLT